MEIAKIRHGRRSAPYPLLTLCASKMVIFNVPLSSLLDESKGVVWHNEGGYLAFKNERGVNSYSIDKRGNFMVARIPIRVEALVRTRVRKEGNIFISDYKL